MGGAPGALLYLWRGGRHGFDRRSAALKSWALAIAIAMVAVQAMHMTGTARIDETFYLSTDFHWAGAIVGGLMFGLGMALVGTCGFGTLVRIGGVSAYGCTIGQGVSGMAHAFHCRATGFGFHPHRRDGRSVLSADGQRA